MRHCKAVGKMNPETKLEIVIEVKTLEIVIEVKPLEIVIEVKTLEMIIERELRVSEVTQGRSETRSKMMRIFPSLTTRKRSSRLPRLRVTHPQTRLRKTLLQKRRVVQAMQAEIMSRRTRSP